MDETGDKCRCWVLSVGWNNDNYDNNDQNSNRNKTGRILSSDYAVNSEIVND